MLRRLAIDKATVAAAARELGRSWDTVNQIAVEATSSLLLSAGPARLDGVAVVGVDEHRWAHTRHADGDGYVTVIVDLTAVVAGRGPARLLDVVPGRSAAAFSGWLAERSPEFRDRVEIVAMAGFGGYKNASLSHFPCSNGTLIARYIRVQPAVADPGADLRGPALYPPSGYDRFRGWPHALDTPSR